MAKEDESSVDRKDNMTRSIISWSLYGALVVSRILVGPFLNGYVHPDELFQSGQEIWYGHPPIIAWEFEPENALRSVLPPGIVTGIPLQLYEMLMTSGSRRELTGREVLVVPRFACAFLSVVAVDWSIWSVISTVQDKKTSSVPLPMLLLASSWPTIVLLNRPFSNAMETYMVALLVAAVLSTREKTIQRCVYIGVICALGMFTRFTFVFFAIPVMLLFLYDLLMVETCKMNSIKRIMAAAMAFFVVSFAVASTDTVFYSSDYFSNKDIKLTSLSIRDMVVTPWNALMYNSKVSNLQEHGLHPRWTHGLVNMFILFGPLTLLGYWKVVASLFFLQQNQPHTDEAKQQQSDRITKLACWMVLSGLGFLSLAPHQEPRFLLPLLVPLVLSACRRDAIWKERRSLQALATTVWILFNLILFTLFGVLHQSGVVPSMLDLGQVMADQQPSAILYYHTYMPPSFLLRHGKSKRDEICVSSDKEAIDGYCSTVGTFGTLEDLNGSDWTTLEKALETRLECEKKSSSGDFIVLVMPTMIREENDQVWTFTPDMCKMPGTSYDCHLLRSHGNHLSTEDLPPFGGSMSQFYRNMALNVYQVSCSTS